MDKNEVATTTPKRRPLPVIADIYTDVEKASEMNELNRLLNSPPKPEWLRNHPMAKRKVTVNGTEQSVPAQYIPIGILEYLVAAIFVRSETVIKSSVIMANAVVVTVTVTVIDPITGEPWSQDGIGAAPIRTNKGAAATDFAQIQDSAVQTAAPAAKTYAEKDAIEKFGKLFGRDLNRVEDNVMNFSNLDNQFPEKLPEEIKMVIQAAESLEDITRIVDQNPQFISNNDFFKLVNDQKEAIKLSTIQNPQ